MSMGYSKLPILIREVKIVEEVYCSVEFFDQFKRKYCEYIRPEIVSVSLINSDEAVWLEYIRIEITEEGFENNSGKVKSLSIWGVCNE